MDASNLLWTQSSWLAEVHRWIDDQLARQNVQRLTVLPFEGSQWGEQFHIRPWSTVIRISTNAGNLYFKAVIPDLAAEAALTDALFRWCPDWVPKILAVERQRGWLLLADGGIRLRERLQTIEDTHHWEKFLPHYASLQRSLAQHVDELLEIGVCDRRLSTLPRQFQALLEHHEVLHLNHPDGLTQAEYDQLQQCVEIVTHLCSELTKFRIPETIEHGDLHDGNVFVLNGCYRFFDWGDSGISHPFFSFHRIFGNLEQRFELSAGSAWGQRLRECYLEVWHESFSQEQLRLAFDLAQRLAAIPAALRWLPVLGSMDAIAREKYVYAVPELMRELLRMVQK